MVEMPLTLTAKLNKSVKGETEMKSNKEVEKNAEAPKVTEDMLRYLRELIERAESIEANLSELGEFLGINSSHVTEMDEWKKSDFDGWLGEMINYSHKLIDLQATIETSVRQLVHILKGE